MNRFATCPTIFLMLMSAFFVPMICNAQGSEEAPLKISYRALVDGSATINRVVFCKDHRALAVGLADGRLVVLDSERLDTRFDVAAHAGEVRAISFLPGARTVVTGGDDENVKLWDVESGELLRTIAHSAPVMSLSTSSDGETFAFGTFFKDIQVWDARSMTRTKRLYEGAGYILALCFSPSSGELACGKGLRDSRVSLWDTKRGMKKETKTLFTGAITDIAYAPDGNLMAVSSVHDGTILCTTNPEMGEQVSRQLGPGQCAAFSSDGEIITIGGTTKGELRLVDAKTFSSLGELHQHTRRVRAVTFCGSRNSFVSGGDDGKAILWTITK